MSGLSDRTRQIVAEIRWRAQAGQRASEIAAALGMTSSNVRRSARRNGIVLAARQRAPQKRSGVWAVPGNDERLAAGYREGKSREQLAKEIGCTPSAIGGRARRLKLPPHPNASGPIGQRKPRKSHAERKAITERNKAERAATPYSPQFTGQAGPKPVAHLPKVIGTVSKCCFPMWGDNERSGGINAQFCCEPTLPGRSWCHTHYAVCFTPSSRQQANAA